MHSVSINDFVRQISAENRRSRVSTEGLDLRCGSWVSLSLAMTWEVI